MWMLLFFNYERQTVGFGLCLRDEFGYFVKAKSFSIAGIFLLLALAYLEAMNWVNELEYIRLS